MKSLSRKIKNQINEKLRSMNDYHSEIPLHRIFSIIREFDIHILENGKEFHGFFTGTVGSTTLALSQPTNNSIYVESNICLMISWYQMANGNFKIISYIA